MRAFIYSFAAAVLFSVIEASSVLRNPLSAVTVVKDPTILNTEHLVAATSRFSITFSIANLHVKLDLEPNHDILNPRTNVRHLDHDGKTSHFSELQRAQRKVFKGTAFVRSDGRGDHWDLAGWARVLMMQPGTSPLFEGSLTLDGDHYSIQLISNYVRTKHPLDPHVHVHVSGQEDMVAWRHSDALPFPEEVTQREFERGLDDMETLRCSVDALSFNTGVWHPVYGGSTSNLSRLIEPRASQNDFQMSRRLFSRQASGGIVGAAFINTIGSKSGCPAQRMVASVGIATDCTYTRAFDSIESAKENILQMLNTASGLWEDTFNIAFSLANLTISNSTCPESTSQETPWNRDCSSNLDANHRLRSFTAWRINQRDINSHWTLLTSCKTGSTVGVSWLGQACVNDNADSNSTVAEDAELNDGIKEETVSGANLVVRAAGSSEWQVFAHETAHTFGAVHDCTSQTCSSFSSARASQRCCPASTSACASNEAHVMNPSSKQGIQSFSPCSVGNVCSAIGRKIVGTGCLRPAGAIHKDATWLESHKVVAIAVPSSLGFAIVLGSIYSCFWRSCYRKASRGHSAKLLANA